MKLTVLIGALVISLFAVLALGNFFGDKKEENGVLVQPQAQAPMIAQVNILVAKQDIPIGTTIDETLYDIKPVAQHLLPPGAIEVANAAQPQIKGMITSTSIVINQPILTSMLRNPNDPGYIAGQLAEGMRAVTIQVGLTEGLSGLISPGDKVDVLYSHEMTSFSAKPVDLKSTKAESVEAKKTASVNVSEVLIPNLKILAVDKKVVAGGTPEQQAAAGLPQSVTLEVNLRDAQKLMLAASTGKLSLALRSIKDKDKFDIVRPTAEQDLSRILPPAYFSKLYDSDANYDLNVVDPYANGAVPVPAEEQEKTNKIKLYRGSQLQEIGGKE